MWPRELASQSFDEVMAIYGRAAARPGEITTAQTVQSLLALVAAGVGIGVMADSSVLARHADSSRPRRRACRRSSEGAQT